jgi:hypothetical protein
MGNLSILLCSLICRLLNFNINIFNCLVNYNVLLLSDVVLLMAGSTNSVPMTFGHGYQTAMPTPYYYTTTYASAGYYTIKAPVNYTTPYDAPSYYTDALNYRYPSVAASSKCVSFILYRFQTSSILF